MHWVLQEGVLKKPNLRALVEALERAMLPYSVVGVPRGELRLVPEVDPAGPVMVSGAVSMARIAERRGWRPGSFLNDNFDFIRWKQALGDELLNSEAEVTTMGDLSLDTETFVRPLADTKEFDGRVFSPQSFEGWRADNGSLLGLYVLAAPTQQIYREYRLFMIEDQVITGSQYMQAGRPYVSSDVDTEALAYAKGVASLWRPAEAFVIDVALTPVGYRVIEFNNINSSGFYNSDVNRYVMGMEARFG